MYPSSPCYNCPDRKPICHDTCEKYLSFKEELARVKEIMRKEDELAYTARSGYYRRNKQTRRPDK